MALKEADTCRRYIVPKLQEVGSGSIAINTEHALDAMRREVFLKNQLGNL